MGVEEGFLEEVALKTNGLLSDREPKERHLSQQKHREQRYKAMEMCGIWRSL